MARSLPRVRWCNYFFAAFLAGAFLAGAFFAGAFFAGAFFTAFLTGAFFATFLAGAFFADAFVTATDVLPRVAVDRRRVRAPPRHVNPPRRASPVTT